MKYRIKILKGKAIKALRKKYNIQLQQLALIGKVSVGNLSGIESGKLDMLKVRIRLTEFFEGLENKGIGSSYKKIL